MSKIGRNDPCTCGSGRKYKHCCMDEAGSAARGQEASPPRAALLPAVRSRPRPIAAPPLAPQLAAYVLSHSGFRQCDPDVMNQVVGYWELMDWSRDDPWRWSVGGQWVRLFGPDPGAASRHDIRMSCTCGGPSWPCAHMAAVLLVRLWRDPAVRPVFDTPLWQIALDPLLSRPPAVPSAPADVAPRKVRPGWIRYRIARSSPSASSDYRVSRELVRFSLRTGEPLRPAQVPERPEDLGGAADGVGEVDVQIARRLAAWEELQRAGKGWSGRSDGFLAEAVKLLAGAREVVFEDRPVRVEAGPVALSLAVREAGDGALRLTLDPELVAAPWLGERFGLTPDGVLAPLDPGTPPGLTDLVGRPVLVPAEEVPRFTRELFSRDDLPLVVARGALGLREIEATPEARLLLAEEDDGLVVQGRVAYVGAAGLEVASVVPGRGGPVLPARRATGEPALLVRDREAERALWQPATDLLGQPLPLRLEGDAALDFLCDTLPALREKVKVLGEESLLKLLLAGRLTPQVTVTSGIDWFDLRARFQVAGEDVDVERVLAAWRRGRRYVELGRGRVARLPEAWLQAHGGALEELEELRGPDGSLPFFSAPLALPLAPEAERTSLWRGPERGDLARALDGLEGLPEREIAPEIAGHLRHYQRRGVDWLLFLRDLGLAGCLADDMGLGKTIQTLALLAETHRESGPPSLVVCPTSVVTNWAREAGRFTPGLAVEVHHGPGRRRDSAFDGVDLVVTTYALLRRDDFLRAREWRYVILDEAQNIKNPASHVARAAREVPARHRLALTGTPMENNLTELWSLFHFLMPGFFGSLAAFGRRYAQPIHKERDERALAALRRRLRPFVLRRLKSEVERELPPLTECVLYCELGRAQRAVYESVREAYRQSVLEAVRERGVARSTIHILEALTRLRQACCDTRLLPPALARGALESAKLALFLETLEEALAEGHRTLVFSQWPSLLRLVAAALEERGVAYLYLDGETTERQALVDRWNDPAGPPAFLISLKAGGSGLNLTGADHVIHLDPWWNPAAEAQARDRAHRIGQTRPVVAYKLVARDTVEEKILELQERKRALFEAALETERMVVDSLTLQDLEAVFSPRDGAVEEPELPALPEPPAVAGAVGLPPALQERLAVEGHLSNPDVRELLGLDAPAARRWLQAAMDSGLLVRTGTRRGTRYLAAATVAEATAPR